VDDLDRLAPDAADPVELADAVRNLGATRQELERVAAEDHHNRAPLAAVEVLLAVQPAMLAG
jgi:hypothetical protein